MHPKLWAVWRVGSPAGCPAVKGKKFQGKNMAQRSTCISKIHFKFNLFFKRCTISNCSKRVIHNGIEELSWIAKDYNLNNKSLFIVWFLCNTKNLIYAAVSTLVFGPRKQKQGEKVLY